MILTDPLLDSYQKYKNIILKDMYISMFIAALFTVAKTWKQTKCPSIDDWKKKLGHIYYIHWNTTQPLIPVWMDFENIMLSKISQTK